MSVEELGYKLSDFMRAVFVKLEGFAERLENLESQFKALVAKLEKAHGLKVCSLCGGLMTPDCFHAMFECLNCGVVVDNPDFAIIDIEIECPKCHVLLQTVVQRDEEGYSDEKCPDCGYVFSKEELDKAVAEVEVN